MLSTNHIQNDDELLLLLQQGSENGFTALYERYHKLLYVVAWKYLKSSSAAEDAVQQVFLKLWEGRTFIPATINLRNIKMNCYPCDFFQMITPFCFVAYPNQFR